jgi:hypothetical protein
MGGELDVSAQDEWLLPTSLVVSRTSMNAASVTTMAINQGLAAPVVAEEPFLRWKLKPSPCTGGGFFAENIPCLKKGNATQDGHDGGADGPQAQESGCAVPHA